MQSKNFEQPLLMKGHLGYFRDQLYGRLQEGFLIPGEGYFFVRSENRARWLAVEEPVPTPSPTAVVRSAEHMQFMNDLYKSLDLK
jgi:hypothetical protein